MTFKTPFNTTPFNYSVPASETPQGKERIRAYHEALGRFIDMFSRAEAAVEYVLRHYAETSTRVALVIFQNAGISISIGYVEKLLPTSGLPEDEQRELKTVFSQLQAISRARNSIVHFGAQSIADGVGIVTNSLKRSEETATSFPVSPELLGDMTNDLMRIIVFLHQDHMGRDPGGKILRRALTPGMPTAWKYKHPEQPAAQTRRADTQSPQARKTKRPTPPAS